MIKTTIEYVVEELADRTPDDIDFQRSESSWCLSNVVDEISGVANRLGDQRCMCAMAESEYVREATAEDLKRSGF